MRFSTLFSVGLVAAALSDSATLAQHVIYVNAAATGADDGTSWMDAYTDLQDALCEAGEPDVCMLEFPCEIWVAAGVYKPDGETGDRYATFQMLSNVALYGGFAGWEYSLTQRDWETHETILNGDLNGDDGPLDCADHSDCCVEREEAGCENPACEERVCALAPACCMLPPYFGWDNACTFFASMVCCELGSANRCENSFHVVTAGGTDDSAQLDGFTITGGNAHLETAYQPQAHGGGIFNEGGSPTISNCTFRGNRALSAGGAMYNSADASPLLASCVFVENRSNGGAAIYGEHTDLALIGCRFTANFSFGGTALETNLDSDLTLINCAFDRNVGGPTVVAFNTDLLAIGCGFVENAARGLGGGGVYVNGFVNTAVLIDCDFIGNTVELFAPAGAVRSEFVGLTIDGCTFIGNSSGGPSGAIQAGWGNVTLRNSLFVGNSPGAVWTDFGSAAIVNCAFLGNQGGGTNAYYHKNGSAWVTNCTFAGNRTADSPGARAVGVARGNMTLTNCILWGNSDSEGIDEETQIIIGPGATLTINNSIVDGWTGLLGGTNNTGDDPLFIQESHWDDAGTPDDFSDDEWIDGDYRLQPNSPAINTGDLGAPFLTDTDLDGHARVLCDEVDRGAYEFGIGDYDCDQLINLTDFTAWQACMTGPDGGPYDPGCEPFDFNADDHVDLTDFAGFQDALTGTE